MSKILLQDNLVYPEEKEIIKFEGREPFSIYDNMVNILKKSFEISTPSVIETDLKWDTTAPDKSFYAKWTAERKLDEWTKAEVKILIKGKQNSNTRRGNITIAIKPILKTEVNVGFLQRVFWWVYYFIFYKKKRMNDFYFGKNLINRLRNEIGNFYGIDVGKSE